MKVNRIFPLVGICLSAFLHASEPVRDLADLAKLESKVEAVSKKVMPATVALLAEKTGSSGSGVITTADGLILTAAHVVQGNIATCRTCAGGRTVPHERLAADS